jgi:hypothetical protein
VTLDKESLKDADLILGLSCRVEILLGEGAALGEGMEVPERIGGFKYETKVLFEDPSEIREEIQRVTAFYLGDEIGDLDAGGKDS